jgi:CCR4-NOT transcription complex subunit 2
MVPDFTLPSAYTVTNVPPLSSRMSAFADGKFILSLSTPMLILRAETLFSIFYQHPRDVLQELAAHELMTREWRWHKVLRQWLQKDSPTASSTNPSSSALPLRDLTNGHPIGTPPVRMGDRGEKGVYVFFDAMNWRRERRWLELDYEHLDPMRAGSVVNGAAPAMGGPVGRRLDGVGQMADGVGVGSSSIPAA